MDIRFLFEIIFVAIILVFLVVDLGLLNRKAHVVTLKAAAWQSIFWIILSLGFAGALFL